MRSWQQPGQGDGAFAPGDLDDDVAHIAAAVRFDLQLAAQGNVDASQQGRGVGTAAVALVVAHVEATRPACGEVRLTVHPDNERAQRLYRRAGFRPTGEERDGEPVWAKQITRPTV